MNWIAVSSAMIAATFAFSPPDPQDKVSTARWMARTIEWGVLSTTSTRSDGSAVGEAFGNPYSFADANSGTPYFYASDLDASMTDLFTAQKSNPRATFAISEASLHNASSSATQAACMIGSALGDPENPPCARLVLSGRMVKLEKGSSEDKLARASLFARHPSFRFFPPGHAFFVVKMVVDGVWLIDFYGGAAIIPPAKYLAANTSVGWMRGVHLEVPSPTPIAVPPKPSEKAATARWMAKTLDWGVLSTSSSRAQGTSVGDPFGNPYSFADASTGVPYFYASDLDASMIDIFTASHANPKASLALSEASLGGTREHVRSCEIGAFPFGDPENPPCARLVLSGTIVKLAANTTDYKTGRASLFARHPSFANYPPGHDFFVAKMEVAAVWLIDAYGGAAIISPTDYFAANVSDESAFMV
jgi:hypothetical protein